jgi:hypothetical protein
MRTIPILSGLAILAVIFNHANWHILEDFAAGAAGGYPFLITDQVGKFAIAAFMFIAGYFIAYATSGGKRDLKWGIVQSRLLALLWPWLIWSLLMTVGQRFQGRPINLEEFLRNLFIQYYFIPMLFASYLLAIPLSRWARINARSLLAVFAGLHIFSMAAFYVRVYWAGFPDMLNSWIDLGPMQYLRFGIYFPLGLVYGMYPALIKEPLGRVKAWLPWLLAFSFALSVIETGVAFRLGGPYWPLGGDQTKLTSALVSLSIIACFIVFDRLTVPFKQSVIKLGTSSYGLYLSHYVILGVLAKLVEQFIPWMATQGWLYFPMLFALAVALAVLLMEITARLPTKVIHRYLFG